MFGCYSSALDCYLAFLQGWFVGMQPVRKRPELRLIIGGKAA